MLCQKKSEENSTNHESWESFNLEKKCQFGDLIVVQRAPHPFIPVETLQLEDEFWEASWQVRALSVALGSIERNHFELFFYWKQTNTKI